MFFLFFFFSAVNKHRVVFERNGWKIFYDCVSVYEKGCETPFSSSKLLIDWCTEHNINKTNENKRWPKRKKSNLLGIVWVVLLTVYISLLCLNRMLLPLFPMLLLLVMCMRIYVSCQWRNHTENCIHNLYMKHRLLCRLQFFCSIRNGKMEMERNKWKHSHTLTI